MSGPSNIWKANFLSALFGSTALPAIPATSYLAAMTVMSADDGTGGTECAIAGGYARIAIVNNTTNFPVATQANPSLSKLHILFSFPPATLDWMSASPIVGFELRDAATAGVYLASAYALSSIGIAVVETVGGLFTFTAAHGRSAGDAVGMFVSSGGTLPTGFSAWNVTTYYVIASGLTSTAFKLSAIQGGSAIIPSTVAIGALFVGQSYVSPVRNGTTLTIPVDAFVQSLTSR